MVIAKDDWCDGDCDECERALMDFDRRECCRHRNLVRKHEAQIRELCKLVDKLLAEKKAPVKPANTGRKNPAKDGREASK